MEQPIKTPLWLLVLSISVIIWGVPQLFPVKMSKSKNNPGYIAFAAAVSEKPENAYLVAFQAARALLIR